jgi:hypothetical protein
MQCVGNESDGSAELLAGILKGDLRAMVRFHGLHFARLANFLWHATASVDLVEELISNTMLDVWRDCVTVTLTTDISNWVMGI